jgi:insertion element IS1 protein InsB
VDPHQHVVSTRMTQQRERNHLTLRTRVTRTVRKTLCFSRSIEMHESVIGLFVNRFEFGVNVSLEHVN